MLKKLMIGTIAAGLMTGASMSAASAEKLKIALVDGLSGAFAANGQSALRELKFATAKYFGDKAEVIGLDGKTSPKDTLAQVKNAISQGARVIVQGNSSGVAHAIVSAVNKHNDRNPKKRVIFLNHSAVDPALTETKCSVWHFRYDAHVGMKLQAMIGAIAVDKSIKSVYIIGQDYSYGKAVAGGTVAFLKALRPDVKVVGNELHPLARVKDFSPYAKKIQKANPDVVITGNWGADMVRLARALGDANVNARLYTFYGAGTGVTATIGASGKNRLFTLSSVHNNPKTTDEWAAYRAEFKKSFPKNDLIYPNMVTLVRSLDAAIKKAGSTEAFAVVKALEGLSMKKLDGSDLTMRAEDHQMLMPLHLAVHTNDGINVDYDNSGYGTVVKATIPAKSTTRPVKCKMVRPTK